MYAGEPADGLHLTSADGDDDAVILRDIYRAAEAGLELYLDLAQHADTAHLRAAASFILACLWTRAATSVPILRRQLALEQSAPARASIVFALGRLQGADRPDPALQDRHTHDASPLVRLLAAVGLVRAAGDDHDSAVATLIAAVHDPDSVPGYDDLPCGERDLPGDIGYVLRSLPPALGPRALPALCAALARAEDFGTMGLVEALLAFTFGEPDPGASDVPTDADPDADPDSEDMSEQSAPPTLDPA